MSNGVLVTCTRLFWIVGVRVDGWMGISHIHQFGCFIYLCGGMDGDVAFSYIHIHLRV